MFRPFRKSSAAVSTTTTEIKKCGEEADEAIDSVLRVMDSKIEGKKSLRQATAKLKLAVDNLDMSPRTLKKA